MIDRELELKSEQSRTVRKNKNVSLYEACGIERRVKSLENLSALNRLILLDREKKRILWDTEQQQSFVNVFHTFEVNDISALLKPKKSTNFSSLYRLDNTR